MGTLAGPDCPAVTIAQTFDDFDAFTSAVEDVDVRCITPRVHRPQWLLRGFQLPSGLRVQLASMGSGNIAEGATPADGWSIFLQRPGIIRANGSVLPLDSAFVIPPKAEFYLSISSVHSWISIFVPSALLDEAGLGAQIGRPSTAHVVPTRRQTGDRLWRYVSRSVAELTNTSERTLSPAVICTLEHAVLEELRGSFGEVPEPRSTPIGRPRRVNRQVIMKAAEIIRARPEQRLSMSDLVCISGVSQRSLRYGFNKYLGVSPRRYKMLIVLNAARQKFMSCGAGESTVTGVLSELGVWDHGRFAARYREVFGETPSSTLGNRQVTINSIRL